MKRIALALVLLCNGHAIIAKTMMKTPENSLKGSVPLDGHHSKQLPFAHKKKINPPLIDLFEQAAQAIAANNLEEAMRLYTTIIKDFPGCSQAYLNRGLIFAEQGNYQDAITDYTSALAINPNYFKALFYAAQAYKALHDYDNALIFYTKALTLEPEDADIHKDLSEIYIEKEDFYSAAEHAESALKKNPENRSLLFQLGSLYNLTRRSQKSLELYYRLLQHLPNNPSLLYNVGYTLKHLNKVDEAIPFFKATIDNPQANSKLIAEANFSLGLLYLTKGDFEQGWPLYEWRWKREDDMKPRNLGKPQWDGSDLCGKTLFIHAEQGLGDTYQFIRFAEMIKHEYHARIAVAVQDSLFDILSLCPYIDQLTRLSETIPYFDEHIPLLSIPQVIKLSINTIPLNVPYLHANEQLVREWQTALAQDKNFKIGLCYQGNNKYTTAYLRATVAEKSVPIEQFIPFNDIPGLSIYCLQQDTGIGQLESVEWNLITFDDAFDQAHGRFMDTAALMKNLDLVITIDTSIAHLAGGLGVPVWVLLPNPADWRWMLDRSDTPWYPTMRLWRQTTAGDWGSVIQAMTAELLILMQKSTINETHVESMPSLEQLTQQRDELTKQMERLTQASEATSYDPYYVLLTEKLKTYHSLNTRRTDLDNRIRTFQQDCR